MERRRSQKKRGQLSGAIKVEYEASDKETEITLSFWTYKIKKQKYRQEPE